MAHMDIKAFAKSFLVPFSFILPIATLYIFNSNSFQSAWKGRFPYLFFLWLFFLELALVQRKLPENTFGTSKWTRTLATAITMAVPTAYVISTYMFGLRSEIIEMGSLLGLPPFGYAESFLTYHWPLSLEYLVFTTFFVASVLLTYGIGGLKRFPVSIFFLGATSFFFMIDTFYPYGALVALQNFVPLTASSVTSILNWMGYQAQWFHFTWYQNLGGRSVENVATILKVSGGRYPIPLLAIYWPSSGIHSLFIYTFVILLFIKNASFSLQQRTILDSIPLRLKVVAKSKKMSFLLKRKIVRTTIESAGTFFVDILRMVPIYVIVAVGAVGTFFVNVLRIVTIAVIGLNTGAEVARLFHDYYGELYFIAWIMLYLFVIVFGPKILARLVKMRRNRL